MKTALFALLVAGIVAVSSANSAKCLQTPYQFSKTWIDMVDPCIAKMKSQIKEELKAAITYMSMGAHFSKDTVNRPGFSKFFFDSASEEREHAIKLINYLLMRGELTESVHKLINENIVPERQDWTNGVNALEAALALENHVTRKIRDIIITCEAPPADAKGNSFNDYHLVDWLTGEYLEEQHKAQRELAGMISVLGRMMGKQGELGEWLFDKKLTSGEPL